MFESLKTSASSISPQDSSLSSVSEQKIDSILLNSKFFHITKSILFPLTLFLSAALLFSIQPMVAKSLLPFYGGTPAVWTVCMLFFQVLLLAGYGYAWFLSCLARKTGLAGKLWWVIHIGLTLFVMIYLIYDPLQFNPILLQATAANPEQLILTNLLRQIGLLGLLLASSSPLLQFVYNRTMSARDPYFLFVASNVGSLLALLSYPFLVERFFGLREQFYYWTSFYLVYLGLLGVLLVLSMRLNRVDGAIQKVKPLSWHSRLVWIVYGFIPCSLMLGMTFYITTDIAAIPMLWVMPLTVYLLSFIFTFVQKPLISREWLLSNVLFFIIFLVISLMWGTRTLPIWQLFIIHLVMLGIFSLVFHGELYRLRPPASQLTSFYWYLALGGVLAGVFNGVIAARLFNGAYEYPLVFLLAILMLPKDGKRVSLNWTPLIVLLLLLINYLLPNQIVINWFRNNHVFAILGLISVAVWPGNRFNLCVSLCLLLFFELSPGFNQQIILSQQRDFYGVKQVVKMFGAHALISHNTIHGFQVPGQSRETNGKLAYYAPASTVVTQLQRNHSQLRATIIGVGAGTMACQFRATDLLEMVDIDTQMIEIARNSRYFTFLHDCAPQVHLIVGDGRIVTKKLAEASRELIVMDAFSSDSVPTHLLTREAIDLYLQKLTADGAILVNISNRHINLLPVLTASARKFEQIILYKTETEVPKYGQFPSVWALLTSNEEFAAQMLQAGWHFVADSEELLWTDDYSNVLPLLRWYIGSL